MENTAKIASERYHLLLNPFPTKRPLKTFIFSTQNFICGVPSFCNRSIFIIFVVQVCKDRLIFYIIHVSSSHFQIGRRFLLASNLVEISDPTSIKTSIKI